MLLYYYSHQSVVSLCRPAVVSGKEKIDRTNHLFVFTVAGYYYCSETTVRGWNGYLEKDRSMVPGVLFPLFGQKQIMDMGIFICYYFISGRVVIAVSEHVCFPSRLTPRPEHENKITRAKVCTRTTTCDTSCSQADETVTYSKIPSHT